MNAHQNPAEEDQTEPPDSSAIFVRRQQPKPSSKLGEWNQSFVKDTGHMVNLWASFAVFASIGMIAMLIWPSWLFKNPQAGYIAAGWCAFSAAVCAAIAFGFWRRHAWAGVVGVILPALSALLRTAVFGLAFAANKPVKWNAWVQILISVWLAWMSWQWLKEQREMVALDAALDGIDMDGSEIDETEMDDNDVDGDDMANSEKN